MTRKEAIERIKDHKILHKTDEPRAIHISEALDMAIKALEQEPKTGHWLRMSDLSEYEDDRYMCSCCGNVVHYTLKKDLYTFNSWCGRCGSDNGRHVNYEVEE